MYEPSAEKLRQFDDKPLNKVKLFNYQRIDGMLGSIVSRGLATLFELQTIYSYQDALTFYDIILTNDANEIKASDFLLKNNRS